jgi:NADPH2:quinone reductase
MTATMRALRAHDLTGPPGLWVEQIPTPAPPDQDAVRIDVHAAGVGFVDTLVTRGLYQVRQEPPFTPGMEVAGVVADAPDGSGLRVGQRVYASLPVGGCAETVWAQPHLVAPLTDSLSAAQGAALVVNDHTAYVALVRRAGIRPGESVLVHGAAGGLGSAAVRIAVALGARVTAVASTSERRAAATAAGAHQVYGPDDWLDMVRAGGGADIIVDPIGGDVFDASLRALAPEGRLLTLGYVSGRIPSAPANRLLLRNCDVRGVNWGGLIGAHPELFRSTADALATLLADGMPAPTTVEYDLTDAEAAFTAIEQRNVIGKTVLLVRKTGADSGMNSYSFTVQDQPIPSIPAIERESRDPL